MQLIKATVSLLLLAASSIVNAYINHERLDLALSDLCIYHPKVQVRGNPSTYYLPNEAIGITGTNICVYKDAYGQYFEKGELKLGQKDGVWMRWWENGQKIWERRHVNGSFEEGKYWHENGQLKKESSSNGPTTLWHSKPHEWSSYDYYGSDEITKGQNIGGKRDGQWTTRSANGRLVESRQYSLGEPTGTWTRLVGTAIHKATFTDGKCSSWEVINDGDNQLSEVELFLTGIQLEREWDCPLDIRLINSPSPTAKTSE